MRHLGRDDSVWADHTDLRPTMLALTGLRDDYVHQGRALFEVMTDAALPRVVRDNLQEVVSLARLYKQIEAPVGPLGLAVLAVSTQALAGDATRYSRLEGALKTLTQRRDALGAAIEGFLESLTFGSQVANRQDAEGLKARAEQLLESRDDTSRLDG